MAVTCLSLAFETAGWAEGLRWESGRMRTEPGRFGQGSGRAEDLATPTERACRRRRAPGGLGGLEPRAEGWLAPALARGRWP